MMKQRYGRIVNISSVSGQAGQAGQTNYSASKAGVIALQKRLHVKVASRQITVNAVAPGFIPTFLTNDLSEELKNTILKCNTGWSNGKTREDSCCGSVPCLRRSCLHHRSGSCC